VIFNAAAGETYHIMGGGTVETPTGPVKLLDRVQGTFVLYDVSPVRARKPL
jgi:hypothetical protein